MKYLRIASKSRTNSVDMFTLGVSTATGTEKIGQFGSGSLMGTLCWMREEGDSPIFGLNGSRVEFECLLTKKSDGTAFRQVFQNENGNKIPLTVSLEYGQVDWTKPEMGLREWISNAIDQGADLSSALSIIEESDMDFPEDQVVVYVPYCATVRKYWQNIDTYFLHFLGLEKQETLIKEQATPCKVYRRGVLIREMEFKTICDYNLDFDINESRNGSSDSIETRIKRYCIGLDGKHSQEYISRIESAVLSNLDCVEVRSTNYYENLYGPFKQYFAERSGYTVHPGHEQGKGHTVQQHWYSRIISANSKLDGMANVGKSVREGNIIVQNPAELNRLANSVWEMIDLAGLTNGKSMPQVECFKTRDGSNPIMLGMYDQKLQTVSVWERAINQETLIHEFGHHITGADDRTREFTSFFIRLSSEYMKLAFSGK
jgi:predicted Zn-dependent protease with MMP-like domain